MTVYLLLLCASVKTLWFQSPCARRGANDSNNILYWTYSGSTNDHVQPATGLTGDDDVGKARIKKPGNHEFGCLIYTRSPHAARNANIAKCQ